MFDETEFQRFKETLDSDTRLKEIVDSAIAEAMHGKSEQWLLPYVNAPGLRSKPWKKAARPTRR
jgi:hypothetical protein